jgi:hypothetical protein
MAPFGFEMSPLAYRMDEKKFVEVNCIEGYIGNTKLQGTESTEQRTLLKVR